MQLLYLIPQLFPNSVVSLLKASFMETLLPLSLFTVFSMMLLSLKFANLNTIVLGRFLSLSLLFLFILCARSIIISLSIPNFSLKTLVALASDISHVSPSFSSMPSIHKWFHRDLSRLTLYSLTNLC